MDEAVNHRLDRELQGIASHEIDLDSREATLVEGRKMLEETWLTVLAHELIANVRAEHLDTNVEELANREKQ
jgi:hypothetical protein